MKHNVTVGVVGNLLALGSCLQQLWGLTAKGTRSDGTRRLMGWGRVCSC